MIKVILTDSNEKFRREMADYLSEKPDIQVVAENGNGRKCLQTIAEHEPDVVVMEMIMPHLDGLGVLDCMKQNDSHTKFIVLTSVHSEKMVQRALTKGAADYLIKPFQQEALYERICDIHLNWERGTVPVNNLYLSQGENGDLYAHQVAEAVQEWRPAGVELTYLLQQMGVPPQVLGYRYLQDAILLVIKQRELLQNITKNLYPVIAERYDSTSKRVERDIRHAIHMAWENGNTELLQDYFRNSASVRNGKPGNSEFIATVSSRLQAKY